MKKRFYFRVTVSVIFLFLVCKGTAQVQQDVVLTDLEEYVARTCHYLGDCPYAIVVSRKGQVIYEKYSKGGGALGEIKKESRWQLFSATKSFICSTPAMSKCWSIQLTQQGR